MTKQNSFPHWSVKRLKFEVEYQKRVIVDLQKAISQSRRDIIALKKEIKARRDSKRVRTWKKKMNGLLKKTLQKKLCKSDNCPVNYSHYHEHGEIVKKGRK